MKHLFFHEIPKVQKEPCCVRPAFFIIRFQPAK